MALVETKAAVSASATTTVTVTLDAGPSAGDKLIAVVHHSDDYPTISGWTQDAEDAGASVVRIFSKIATGSEGTGFTFTAPTSGAMAARVMRYTGVSTLDAVSAGSTGGTGAANIGSMTTTSPEVLYVGAAAVRASTVPSSDLTWSGGVTSVAADAVGVGGSFNDRLAVGTRVISTPGAYTSGVTYTELSTTTSVAKAVAYDMTDPNGAVAAVPATGTGAAVAPVVSVVNSGTVTAVKATGTGVAEPPQVSGTTVISGGGPAAGSGIAVPPSVSVTAGPGQVIAVKATGTGTAPAPAVTATVAVHATVTAVKATGSGAARAPGVAVVETLPTNTQTGRVTGRFATGKVLIGDVDGIANLYPITDRTITFTSTAAVLLNATAEPSPIVIELDPIVCTLNVNGYLVDTAGHQWVDLIATNDTDLTPTSRKWRVTPGAGFAWSAFEMTLAAGATVDLVTVIPT